MHLVEWVQLHIRASLGLKSGMVDTSTKGAIKVQASYTKIPREKRSSNSICGPFLASWNSRLQEIPGVASGLMDFTCCVSSRFWRFKSEPSDDPLGLRRPPYQGKLDQVGSFSVRKRRTDVIEALKILGGYVNTGCNENIPPIWASGPDAIHYNSKKVHHNDKDRKWAMNNSWSIKRVRYWLILFSGRCHQSQSSG